MHIIIPPYKPDAGRGFGDDIFNRKIFAKSLTNLIKRTNDPLVISLNGPWGEGKTTFVKAWQKDLDDQNIPNLYIDAFASDYVNDAFMVVAGAITDYIKENAPPDKTDAFLDKAKHVGAHLLSVGTKIAIKAASAGLLDSEDFKLADKAVEDAGSELATGAESYIRNRLNNHKKDLDSITNFKSYLSSIPNLLNQKSGHSLTIIIDELDRCRPSFAVEMLEKIKHLFSVHNVTFILVINKTQLQESIRFTYGPNIDAHVYLQKFLTFETEIPRRGRDQKGVVKTYCEYLANAHEFQENDVLIGLFAAIGEHFSLTLRQLEKVFSNYALLSASIGEPRENDIGVYVGLCVLKISHPEIFEKLKTIDISYGEFYRSLKYQGEHELIYAHELTFTIKWIGLLLMDDDDLATIDQGSMEIHMQSRLLARDRQKFLKNAISNLTMFELK